VTKERAKRQVKSKKSQVKKKKEKEPRGRQKLLLVPGENGQQYFN
jgi:hypothetical protein